MLKSSTHNWHGSIFDAPAPRKHVSTCFSPKNWEPPILWCLLHALWCKFVVFWPEMLFCTLHPLIIRWLPIHRSCASLTHLSSLCAKKLGTHDFVGPAVSLGDVWCIFWVKKTARRQRSDQCVSPGNAG